MLEPFGEALWVADGPVVTAAAGFRYPTRMAVIRLASGDLVIWSPVALTGALRAATEALGRVRYILPPNSLHHTFLGEWQRAYPDAQILAPPKLRAARPDIRFAADLGDASPVEWADEIDLAVVHGQAITTEVVLFHRPSATVIFCDLLQHLPAPWFQGWRAVVARLDLMTGDEPAVPRKFRMAFVDRPAAQAAIRKILAWPAERVLFAHGQPVHRDGREFLARAFHWLV